MILGVVYVFRNIRLVPTPTREKWRWQLKRLEETFDMLIMIMRLRTL